MTRNKGILYLALCAALWSTAGVFIKLIDWNSLVIGGFRSATAAACSGSFSGAGAPRGRSGTAAPC